MLSLCRLTSSQVEVNCRVESPAVCFILQCAQLIQAKFHLKVCWMILDLSDELGSCVTVGPVLGLSLGAGLMNGDRLGSIYMVDHLLFTS